MEEEVLGEKVERLRLWDIVVDGMEMGSGDGDWEWLVGKGVFVRTWRVS